MQQIEHSPLAPQDHIRELRGAKIRRILARNGKHLIRLITGPTVKFNIFFASSNIAIRRSEGL